MQKDNFSAQAADYAKFRPSYPPSLITELLQRVQGRGLVWDCGTGNGQLATQLAPHFAQVFATDISAKQLQHAPQVPNIRYQVEAAEHCSLPNQSADLIVVGQAIHWFNFATFYAKVCRVAKPDAILAAFGYPLCQMADPSLEAALHFIYEEILGAYWDAERKHVDCHFASLPFPFKPLEFPTLEMVYTWTKADFLGYLETWSAVQHYRRRTQTDPIALFLPKIEPYFAQHETVQVRFEIIHRVAAVSTYTL